MYRKDDQRSFLTKVINIKGNFCVEISICAYRVKNENFMVLHFNFKFYDGEKLFLPLITWIIIGCI